MHGIDPAFMSYQLAIDPAFKLVAQRCRKMSPDRAAEVKSQVQGLLDTGFIRELTYSTWLSNMVMVKKSNEKWRMCVDYIDLNIACLKDCFLLPNIDNMINSSSGYQVLSFLHAYSGATYQRLIAKVFNQQIGRNMEIYIDDMLIKTNEDSDLIKDLKEVGIEANPEKCQPILDMSSPWNLKEVQRLTAIKAQAMVDFLAETTHPNFDIPVWELHVDGASNVRCGGSRPHLNQRGRRGD
ncbi:uncharacterized protein LOC130974879 [Arachis stenosperma]|uniref:uncharacterized protein LOC130974879 n=1 Tax=Arachis stenosperma TaxID=217475 RepID=UPI0025AC5E6F|nr:uncharacterized protein LOC130974879 [Arachis stenosperma]